MPLHTRSNLFYRQKSCDTLNGLEYNTPWQKLGVYSRTDCVQDLDFPCLALRSRNICLSAT
jgi:hypothetical protein